MNEASLLTQAALLQESRVVIVIAGMAGAAFRGGRPYAGPGVSPRADRRGLRQSCRASGHAQQKVAAQAQVPNQARGDIIKLNVDKNPKNKGLDFLSSPLFLLVLQAGIEPAAPGLGIACPDSIYRNCEINAAYHWHGDNQSRLNFRAVVAAKSLPICTYTLLVVSWLVWPIICCSTYGGIPASAILVANV